MNQELKGRPGLKALREALDMTQAELAYAVNSAEKTVRNWENDASVPSFDKAVLLAKVLQVSLKDLALQFGLDVSGIPDDSGGEAM